MPKMAKMVKEHGGLPVAAPLDMARNKNSNNNAIVTTNTVVAASNSDKVMKMKFSKLLKFLKTKVSVGETWVILYGPCKHSCENSA